MRIRELFITLLLFSLQLSRLTAQDDLPIVPQGFVVDVVAREPMVSNPCVLAFDHLGRVCIAQGPQWRSAPGDVGDRVDILIDQNGDGIADQTKTFASGFNSIQGIAWHGRDLWIANAPDLTVARDTDGDDQADVYIRVYTGLGNLEHSLHGLNFGPDGKLYMSKGNSKGYNRKGQLAPKAFRELWGVASPNGAPDYPAVEVFSSKSYRRNQHTPADDWGTQGGILRCDPYPVGGKDKTDSISQMGRNLEIVARGFRNPWDIAFDDQFNWLGTDNDQSTGDRIFMPFQGAHFGWGHPWSFSWTGKDHLPTVPISGATFEGSGTGVTHYHASQFPKPYRDLFFIGDWLKREVRLFRPKWDGSLMVDSSSLAEVFAHAGGGRTMPKSEGRVFDPTDLEIGPDGCLYVLSWGHQYGGEIKNGKQVNVGRVYRIRYGENGIPRRSNAHRMKPIDQWSLDQLFDDLGSHVAAWRVNAQVELMRRGEKSSLFLADKLSNVSAISQAQQTWAIWTLARMNRLPLESFQNELKFESPPFRPNGRLTAKQIPRTIQLIRAMAFQADSKTDKRFFQILDEALTSTEPRIRFASIQAVRQAGLTELARKLVSYLSTETDRLAFFAAWNVIGERLPVSERRSLLEKHQGRIRLGILLSLLADDALQKVDVMKFRDDLDPQVAGLAEKWLVSTGSVKPMVSINPPSGNYSAPIQIVANSNLPGTRLTYSIDGSIPSATSPGLSGPLNIQSDTTVRIAVIKENRLVGRVVDAEYQIRPTPSYQGQPFVKKIVARSGSSYQMNYNGLRPGQQIYTDRRYVFTDVPATLQNLPFIQTPNNDDRSLSQQWLSFQIENEVDILIGVDTRIVTPLRWMKLNSSEGFHDTGLVIKGTDTDFRVYRKSFPAGEVVLGGNANQENSTPRANYVVAFDRNLLKPGDTPARLDQVLAAMKTADPLRGRELFMHPRGAGCIKCHAMDGVGQALAPDLADLGNRVKTAEILVQSILDPSAVITEGFAQQLVETFDGIQWKGAVIEETERTLKMVGSDGKVFSINQAEIENRKGTGLSPMPTGYERAMSAQQIADIVAWLMSRKSAGDRGGFFFRNRANEIDIYYKDQRVATYLKRHPKLTRRALVNVRTPSGIPVTRNFPARRPDDIDPEYTGENGIIHPLMHPGIWIGFGDVNGNDYWRLKAPVVFDDFVESPQGSKTKGAFAVRNFFLRNGESAEMLNQTGYQPVLTETTRYQFEKVPEGLLLRIDAEYQSADQDFYFGDQEESGLAIRVASPLRVTGGKGSIINSRGEVNGAEVWGKEAKWFDYSGPLNDRHVGIMVASSPSNPRPSWIHARDYGVVATNPFPKQPKERREPYIKTLVKKGNPYRLSYAVLIHDLPLSQSLDHKAAYRKMLQFLK